MGALESAPSGSVDWVPRAWRRSFVFATITLSIVVAPAIAGAQPADERYVEIGGGLHYLGPVTFDAVDANESGFGGVTRPVFKSQSEFESSPGVGVHIGIGLTRMLQAEWSLAVNHTQLATHLSSDDEAGTATVTEPVAQYVVEGGVMLRPWRRGTHSGPFATAGIGYLRQLHDGHTLVDTGSDFYVGGGVDFLLEGVRVLGSKSAGIRADVRGRLLRNQLTLDGATHVQPLVRASLFFRF